MVINKIEKRLLACVCMKPARMEVQKLPSQLTEITNSLDGCSVIMTPMETGKSFPKDSKKVFIISLALIFHHHHRRGHHHARVERRAERGVQPIEKEREVNNQPSQTTINWFLAKLLSCCRW